MCHPSACFSPERARWRVLLARSQCVVCPLPPSLRSLPLLRLARASAVRVLRRGAARRSGSSYGCARRARGSRLLLAPGGKARRRGRSLGGGCLGFERLRLQPLALLVVLIRLHSRQGL